MPSKFCFPSPVEVLESNPTGLQSQILWGFSIPLPDPQVGKSVLGPRESSDKMWSTGERNGKPLQDSCLENPMKRMKSKKDLTLKDNLPSSVGAPYATGAALACYWRRVEK